MSVSLVVRCFNEEQHIGRLLEGVLQQTVRDVELVVVDSGSTDGTLSIVSRYPVKLLSIKPEDFSFGRSLNLGCEAATGDIIAIASAHVYPTYQDWLERLIAPFADARVALAYGSQRGNDSSHFSEQQLLRKWFPNESIPNQQHPFCNNANSAIRRSLWQTLKYDEMLTGLEDLDWANRAMGLGHTIAYVAEAQIVHVHDESPQRIYNRYRREAIAFKRINAGERFRLWDLVRLSIANISNDWYHAWRAGRLRRNLFDICSFRLMQFWGVYRGFAQRTPVNSQLKRTFYYPNTWVKSDSGEAQGEVQPRVDYVDTPGDQRGE